MRNRRPRTSYRKPRHRSKVRLYLTDAEVEELDRAVAESSAWSRSLLIAEAIKAGLNNPYLRLAPERRGRRVDARVPSRLRDNMKQLAKTQEVRQQSLLRRFLFHYISNGPWKIVDETEAANPKQTESANAS